MINALKLLATKQEDGDGLIQNIVTNLGKGSREGSHGGLRNFTQVDNHRALDVGHLREGVGSFKVTKAERRSRVPRGACQGRRRRINARSRVGAWKSCTNVDRIAKERWASSFGRR